MEIIYNWENSIPQMMYCSAVSQLLTQKNVLFLNDWYLKRSKSEDASIYFSYSDAQKSNCSQQDKVIYKYTIEKNRLCTGSQRLLPQKEHNQTTHIYSYSYKNQQINYVHSKLWKTCT